MTDNDDMELVSGTGNIFRDMGRPDAEVLQTKAILAAEIIKALDVRALSVRQAHAETGIAAADFSRIRNVNVSRFTIDRLLTILDRLGQEVEVSISVRARPPQAVAHLAATPA